MNLNPYEEYLISYNCKTIPEFYCMVQKMAKDNLGLNKLPFPLSSMTHPPYDKIDPDINCFIARCTQLSINDISDAQVITLIKKLKKIPQRRVL